MVKGRVGIIYLSFYPDEHYIDAAMDSIAEQTYAKEDLRVFVVDNSQNGPSAQYIRRTVVPRSGQDLPLTELIVNEENEGFAGGNNIGIEKAIRAECEFAYLLNNDAMLTPTAIEQVVKVARSDKHIGSVQSLMCLWKHPEQMNTIGNDIHFLGFGITRGYKDLVVNLKEVDGAPIGYASAAAALYRLSALQDVGELEELFWMYHEDLELGWRLRLRGWRNVLAASSVVYHDYEFSRSTKKMYWMERNRHITHLIHVSLKTLVLLAPAMVFLEVAVWVGAIKSGWGREKWRSVRDLFHPKMIRAILARRAYSQAHRTVKDRAAMAMFVGTIDHQEVKNPAVTYILNPLMRMYWSLIRKWI